MSSTRHWQITHHVGEQRLSPFLGLGRPRRGGCLQAGGCHGDHIEQRGLAGTALSNVMNLSATTVISGSGNSVGVGGDMASRTVSIDLDAGRADPENRPFNHEDPIAFTRDNRKRILRALYMILCMRCDEPDTADTRFKEW